MEAFIYVHGLRVPACNQFRKPHNGRAGYMETHRVKHVKSEHPFMPGYYIPDCKSSGVSRMKVSVKIGVGDGYEEFFPLVRFGLENSAFIPIFLPFLFDLMRFIFLLHSCSHPLTIMIKESDCNRKQ